MIGQNQTNNHWIAVDWGTSNLRIWHMNSKGEVLDAKQSDKGMNALKPDEFEPALLTLAEGWLTEKQMPVLACGMVGAKQGWKEAPYDEAPTRPAQKTINLRAADPRIDVHIVSGVMQLNPPDVMRGEETQIAGLLVENPNYQGAVCLPGTHSKWAEIIAGEIFRFQTVMTGEIFALLAEQSVLRHTLGDWDDKVFREAALEILDAPERLISQLFSIRARSLLEGDEWGRARLSGYLLGAELAATKPSWEKGVVVLIGADRLARLYRLVLNEQNVETQCKDATTLTLAGLKQVYKRLFEA